MISKVEFFFDICMAIIAGLFAGVVIAMSFAYALVRSMPELWKSK